MEVSLSNLYFGGPKSRNLWEKEKLHLPSGLSAGPLVAPVTFDRGEGSFLWDVDDNRYIDFAAGCYTTMTGHCHPKLVAKMKAQTEKLWHGYDFAIPERHELLSLLNEITPEGIDTFELYSGGTETVEAAMRAGISYTGRYQFVSFHGAYHGKTMGTRSLASRGSAGDFGDFGPLIGAIRVPYANCYRCFLNLTYPNCSAICAEYVKQAIESNTWGKPPAGVVFEPIQSMDGFVMPPEKWRARVIDICQKKGLLIIADEVLTGVGKSGTMFAIEYWGVKPDLITFGKALGSGFPVMALGGRREIMAKEPYGLPYGASSTFGFNALAVCAALTTLRLIQEEDMLENVCRLEGVFKERLKTMQKKHPIMGIVRGKGVLWSIDLVKDQKTKELAEKEGYELYKKCLSNGLFYRSPKPIVSFNPALNSSQEVVEEGLDIFERSLEALERQFRYK